MTNEERAALKRVADATLVLIAAAKAADEAVQALTRTVEAASSALPKPPAEQPEALQPVDTSSVRALVVALFTVGELQRFAESHTTRLARSVDWRGPARGVVFGFIRTTERHGLLNAAFFDALVLARPRREKEIRKVQADYTTGGNACA